MRLPLLLIGLCASVFAVRGEDAAVSVPFYPFQNGLRFESADEGVRLVKELGYQGVGSVSPQDLARIQAACAREGLKVFSIYTGGKVNADGFSYGGEVDQAIALLKGTDALVELNVQRGDRPSDEQAIAFVKEVAEKAKDAGLKVVIYPHAAFHIERVDHAVRIAKATGCDNVGVAFNLCHFLKVQPMDDLAATLEAAKPLLWSVSVCGADEGGSDWATLIRPLDEGTFDQAALLRKLRAVGFKGPVGLQCYNVKVDSRQHLARSMGAWKTALKASLADVALPDRE